MKYLVVCQISHNQAWILTVVQVKVKAKCGFTKRRQHSCQVNMQRKRNKEIKHSSMVSFRSAPRGLSLSVRQLKSY